MDVSHSSGGMSPGLEWSVFARRSSAFSRRSLRISSLSATVDPQRVAHVPARSRAGLGRRLLSPLQIHPHRAGPCLTSKFPATGMTRFFLLGKSLLKPSGIQFALRGCYPACRAHAAVGSWPECPVPPAT